MKKLYTYIGRYWYGYLFAVFSMVTAIVLDMLYPKITQQIVDDVIIGGKLELLTKLLVGIVIVGIGRSIFGYCKEFTFDVLASKIGSAMRKDLFDHIQSLSMGYFEDTNTGERWAMWACLSSRLSFMCPWYCTACFRSTGSWRSCRLPQ